MQKGRRADIIRKGTATTPAAVALAEPGRVLPGDRVAFIGANGPGFVEVCYGAAKCRATFTPSTG